MYGGWEVAQFTVVFGGRCRHFRGALSQMLGLYSTKPVNNYDNIEANSAFTKSVIFLLLASAFYISIHRIL
jgi:hypothetical protein